MNEPFFHVVFYINLERHSKISILKESCHQANETYDLRKKLGNTLKEKCATPKGPT